MASTSSSKTPPTYDVFLSFRGEDTRFCFTAYLYDALRQAGITTFRDDDEIQEGQELKPEIERSIKESRSSIIVFSENFAYSSWCLDELWLILEQKKNASHFVLPVFYKVDPSDVRNQRRNFSVEAKEGTKWTHDNVSRWKAALTEVANLKGMVVSGYETDFIANIVDKIYRELDLKLLSTPAVLTGIEPRAETINSWLKYEQPSSPVLAICGMGGSGKTTIAKYIYNTNKQNFERSSFLEEIEKNGLLRLQKQLLKDVLGNNVTIPNIPERTLLIEKALQRKRMLIVVDDIDDPDKLNTLFGTKVFPTQSKIIITTRLLNIDAWFGSISWRCHVHKLELLSYDESLELLSWHAFGSKIPMKGFEEIAIQLAQYCGGNPLALKVLSSSLSIRAQDQRTKNNMIEIWRSRMNSLNSLKGDLDSKIQGVLHRSFESLPCNSHKELFLHIACLFVGESAADVERILENDWHAKSGIMTLMNRCLLTVSRDGVKKLEMHKLLQDMARRIAREESKEPAKRSRIWHHEESYNLLRKGDGSRTIEGLALDMREATQGMTSEAFKTSSLIKMKNLKLLKLDFVELTGSYENFPELRWLRWYGSNLKTIPSGLFRNCLVAICLRHGDLKKFEPPMVLNSLKILDLSCSYKLVSVCKLHRLPKVETLILWNCTSLTHVCNTIGDLKNLSFLNLTGCIKLWKGSSSHKFVNQLERLKGVFVGGRLAEQPLFSLPQSVIQLCLMSNPFKILPSYINLKMLWSLDLSSCPNLKTLTCLPSTLEELHVDWCSSLENITFQSARFSLRVFNYEGCFKLSKIQGLFKLVPIAKLDEADLGHMKWTKTYQDHKVDLVGDVITKGRTWNIQMLCEYGIRSIYLQGINDQSMKTHEYTSSSEFLSFNVPFHPQKHKIQGLNVTILYRSLGEDRDMLSPFAKICNRTKGLTWVYSPVVYCKPTTYDDVVWLSYWPIKEIFDIGDEIHIMILYRSGEDIDGEMMIVRECGASLVYMDDGEVENKEKCEKVENKEVYMDDGEVQNKEVIGGDLSLFEVTKGGYYLCRHDFFQSRTPDMLKTLFGNDIHYTDSLRWRVSCESVAAYRELNTLRNDHRSKIEVELGVNFNSECETNMIEKAVSSLAGVESVFIQKEIGRLIVVGRVDPQVVVTRVREFEKMVDLLCYKTLL